MPFNTNPSRKWSKTEIFQIALFSLFHHSNFKFKGILKLNCSEEAEFLQFVLFVATIWNIMDRNENIIRLLPRRPPAISHAPLTKLVFFGEGTFDFQVKSLDFLPNLRCLLCENLKKASFFWLELIKKMIFIDMDLSTKTNVTEIIEINVQWKTTFVFRLAMVLKIN